jgi:GT2 family glycosyltransferase
MPETCSVNNLQAASTPLKCAIILLTFESREPLYHALVSAFEQSYLSKEIIVVDNASTDGTLEMVQTHFPDAIIIETCTNAGVAAINAGIDRAISDGCEIMMLVDSDAILDASVVSTLVEVLDSHPQAGIAGPSCYENNRDNAAPVVRVDPRRGLLRTERYVLKTSETDCIGIAMIRKMVFQKIGMIDPAFFAYHQDTDFCVRARRSGFRVLIVPEAKYHHLGAYGTGRVLGLRGFISLRNRAILIRKNFTARNRFSFFARIPVELVKIQADWIRRHQIREFQTTFLSAVSGVILTAGGKEPRILRRIVVCLLGHRITLDSMEAV